MAEEYGRKMKMPWGAPHGYEKEESGEIETPMMEAQERRFGEIEFESLNSTGRAGSMKWDHRAKTVRT